MCVSEGQISLFADSGLAQHADMLLYTCVFVCFIPFSKACVCVYFCVYVYVCHKLSLCFVCEKPSPTFSIFMWLAGTLYVCACVYACASSTCVGVRETYTCTHSAGARTVLRI